MERVEATAEQARAVGSAVRLRILRMCHDEELTNRELADRLDRDPSTILHHTRLLVDAGLLEPAPERPGPRGSTEKPYRATGLSWQLELGVHKDDEMDLAAMEAVREEVRDAGPRAVRGWSRLVLHLDDDEYAQLAIRIQTVLDEYVEKDPPRRAAGSPETGLFLIGHYLDPRDVPPAPAPDANPDAAHPDVDATADPD